MADETSSTKKKKKRSPFGKRQLATEATGTKLWAPDKQLFEEIAKKRKITPGEFLREIVHQWAIRTRLAPDTEEGTQEIALLKMQKETNAQIGSLRKELTDTLKQLAETASNHGELMSLNEAQLNHISATMGAHYNVSAQTFAAIWTAVELFQRFYMEKVLQSDPDPHKAAVTARDNIRAEALRMVERMNHEFKSPQGIRMILIYPSDEE